MFVEAESLLLARLLVQLQVLHSEARGGVVVNDVVGLRDPSFREQLDLAIVTLLGGNEVPNLGLVGSVVFASALAIVLTAQPSFQ